MRKPFVSPSLALGLAVVGIAQPGGAAVLSADPILIGADPSNGDSGAASFTDLRVLDPTLSGNRCAGRLRGRSGWQRAGERHRKRPRHSNPPSNVAAVYEWSLGLGEWFDDGTTVDFAPNPGTPVPGTTTATMTVSGTPRAKLFVRLRANHAL